MKLRDHNRKGFTLIEAMMAMVLLGIATSSVLLPFASGAALHVESARITLAANVASDLLEEIVNTNYDDLWIYETTPEFEGYLMDASGNIFSDPAYAGFSRFTSCQPHPIPGINAAVEMTWVTVYVYDNDVQTVKMSVLVSR
jgi:prepilin-type N-terminal cleavage/methylation domain-containing protein